MTNAHLETETEMETDLKDADPMVVATLAKLVKDTQYKTARSHLKQGIHPVNACFVADGVLTVGADTEATVPVRPSPEMIAEMILEMASRVPGVPYAEILLSAFQHSMVQCRPERETEPYKDALALVNQAMDTTRRWASAKLPKISRAGDTSWTGTVKLVTIPPTPPPQDPKTPKTRRSTIR
jgi:hypothetical protein